MIYHYKGFHGCECVCDIEVYEGRIVKAIEREDNNGTSITNMAESLALNVCHDFNIPLDELIWIEIYNGFKPESDLVTFDIVDFEYKMDTYNTYPKNTKKCFLNPRWKHVTTGYVDKLIANKGIM